MFTDITYSLTSFINIGSYSGIDLVTEDSESIVTEDLEYLMVEGCLPFSESDGVLTGFTDVSGNLSSFGDITYNLTKFDE